MQIGQKLDFRDWNKAVMPHADGEPKDGLFVQQRIKHTRCAKFFLQPLCHAIDAAFARDIFAEHRDIGILQHDICQGEVDALGQSDRLSQVARIFGK